MPKQDQPEYQREQVLVSAHERNGAPVRASLATRLKRIFRIGGAQQDGLRNGVTSIAADEADTPVEMLKDAYRPELFRDDPDLAADYTQEQSYVRRPKPEDIEAAMARRMNPHHRGMAQTLCDTDDLSPEQVERYWHVHDEVAKSFRDAGMSPEAALVRAEDLMGVYTRQGCGIGDADLLSRHGVLGEPSELSPSERERWDDKWQAFRDKRDAFKLTNAVYVEREGLVATPIDDVEVAVVDLETTNLEPVAGARLIEVGITVVNSKGEMLERFQTLINPREAIGQVGDWAEIHKLTEDDVRDAPTFAEVQPEFARLLSGRFFVAQNKHFEEAFISDEMARMGLKCDPMPSLCTVEMSRQFVGKKIKNNKLGTQAEHFGVELGDRAHTAIGDTDATAVIVKAHLDNLRAQGVTHLYSEGPPVTMPGASPDPVRVKQRAG